MKPTHGAHTVSYSTTIITVNIQHLPLPWFTLQTQLTLLYVYRKHSKWVVKVKTSLYITGEVVKDKKKNCNKGAT